MPPSDGEKRVLHMHPLEYVHVTNVTTNITRVESGPQTLVLRQDEILASDVQTCICVPPNHYCVILNPVYEILESGRCLLRHGHKDIRFHSKPFPLYPGEVLVREGGSSSGIQQLPIVPKEHAIRLQALEDFKDDLGVARKAGDEWQLMGPLTYFPKAQAIITANIKPNVIAPGWALHLRATRGFTDSESVVRVTGEEWLVRRPGAYLPSIEEEVVRYLEPVTITEKVALHLRAKLDHKDSFGVQRVAGEEWLVTQKDCNSYLVDVTEESVGVVKLNVLDARQFCVVCNPAVLKDGRIGNDHGARKLVQGPTSFFLQPGESLEKGVESAYILNDDEALVLRAILKVEVLGKKYLPGDVWLLQGPQEYVPPVSVRVVERRQSLKLAQFEGVYVRNIKSGAIRAVMGPQSYMLQADEVLWQKPLQPLLEEILRNGGGVGDESIRKTAYFESSIDGDGKPRDPTRVICYRVPNQCAVQIYQYKARKARVVFGPNLAILGPHEDFNILSLSAGKPKTAHALKCLPIMLGHDYITDQLTVETSDHARLIVRYAVNNHFEYDEADPESHIRIFAVPDFIGFACRILASRIRSAVASTGFEEFHQNSATIIRKAVFDDGQGNSVPKLVFPSNGLVITAIDIQAIEPAEAKTQELLMRSVQMAIEISTRSIEEAASHEARLQAQAARGMLDRQNIINDQESEKSRIKLNELRATTAAVESCGQSKAEAQANAERSIIEANSNIEQIRLRAEAAKIEFEAELKKLNEVRRAELDYRRKVYALEIEKRRRMAALEVKKFADFVKSATPELLIAVAAGGPEIQEKLAKNFDIDIKGIMSGMGLFKNLFEMNNRAPQGAIQEIA